MPPKIYWQKVTNSVDWHIQGTYRIFSFYTAFMLLYITLSGLDEAIEHFQTSLVFGVA